MALFPRKAAAAAAGELDYRGIKERFLAVNRLRLQRIQEALRWRQRDFLDLLPLLFHLNHPMLPGFVSKDTPAGLPDYSPPKSALRAARALAKSFEYKKRAYHRFRIPAIYLMGSTGTVAYSETSDFDLWVCHEPDLDAHQLGLLRDKADAVEAWAASLDLDLHIFLVDPDKFRAGEHGGLSRDGSGSAQHSLLLDEFYRTAVLLAGRYPLWWLVPPEAEERYEEVAETIKRKRFVHAREHIDFGGPARVSPEEFYGATLWLLYKGIDSPYKSVLKILVMEVYASEHPNIELLSRRFKRAIYEGEQDYERLDPYLMMLEKVEAYLIACGDAERLELVRRALYFKANEPLSAADNPRQENWRRQRMARLVAGWGWSPAKLLLLDSRNAWKIQRVSEERKDLVNQFTRSYRFLSQFARRHAGELTMIDKLDLNILGRKLYAAFERKAGKIEVINLGISDNLRETHVSLHHRSEGGLESWMAFAGVVNEADALLGPPLKRTDNALELIAWCFFNGVIDANTVVALYAEASDLNLREVRSIVESLQRLFPGRILTGGNLEDFSRPPQVAAVGTFVNVGLDPFGYHTRRGQHLTSNQTDALKYGGLFENLALSFDQVILTSWQEVLTFRYQGAAGLMACLADYMRWSPPSKGLRPPPLNALSFSSYRGTVIARRIEQFFEELVRCFYEDEALRQARYIIGVEREFYVLHMAEDALQYTHADSYPALLKHLAEPLPHASPVVIDRQTLTGTALPLVFERHTPGRVQFFYQVDGEQVDIYVVDELGSMFHQRLDFYDTTALLMQFDRFLDAVGDRMNLLGQSGESARIVQRDVEYYRIQKTLEGTREAVRHGLNPMLSSVAFFNLQVIGKQTDDRASFTIYCDDREFSSLEHGERLFTEVARYVLQRRRSGEDYPIYITDIDLPRALLAGDARYVQTLHFLNYKKRIEDRLNEAIARL